MSQALSDRYNGILPIVKPAGITSHDAVGILRRVFETRRVGHTGTLDPMATGVLVMLIGRAAKAADFITDGRKRYTATLQLGLTTDTEDTTGTVLTRHTGPLPAPEAVREAAAAFCGEIFQMPPMYSALKVNGQKLVDLARRGVTVEREKRPITIHALDVTPVDPANGTYSLDVTCSRGTYIRTLCADLGAALGCGGAMAALTRTENAHFTLSDCLPLDLVRLMAGQSEALSACLHPIESVFADCPAVTLPPFFAKLAHDGLEIYQKKIGCDLPLGTRVRLCDGDGFFALGEVRDYPDGTAVKPIRQF